MFEVPQQPESGRIERFMKTVHTDEFGVRLRVMETKHRPAVYVQPGDTAKGTNEPKRLRILTSIPRLSLASSKVFVQTEAAKRRPSAEKPDKQVIFSQEKEPQHAKALDFEDQGLYLR